LFGPVILVWLGAIGALGATEVAHHPGVLQGLSPLWGLRFMLDHGVAAFLTLGGVVLVVTGAEALYADRGHFGAWPIRFSWLAVALPCLMLNYLGQAALILRQPSAISNPFLLVLVFRSSGRLADIYGVAVTATFVLNTLLFVAVARSLWRVSKWLLVPLAGLFLGVEVSFFGSNLAKVAHGAWLPLVVGLLM